MERKARDTPEIRLDFIASKMGTTDLTLMALHLGLTVNDIERIQCDYKSPHEQKFQILWEWYNKKTSPNYLDSVVTALDAIENRLVIDEISKFDPEHFIVDSASIPLPTTHLSDQDLDFLSDHMVSDYQRIGRFLGMDEGKLASLKEKSVKDKAFKCLKGCKKKRDLTRQAMCNALLYAERGSLMSQLLQKWKP